MHKIDPSFSQRHSETLKAKGKRRLKVAAAFSIVSLLAGAALYFAFFAPLAPTEIPEDAEIAQVDGGEDAAAPAYEFDMIDLAGDPLRINAPDAESQKAKLQYYVAPRILQRYGVTGNIGYFHDKILPSGAELMITLPSTQRDFAFYQSQKTDAGEATLVTDNVPVGSQPAVEAPADATQQAVLTDGGEDDLEGTDEQWKKGTIENNISSDYLLPEGSRMQRIEDRFVKVTGNPELVYFLAQHEVNSVIGKFAADAMQQRFGVSRLEAGSILALRFQRAGGLSDRRRLVQLALYAPGKYIGALAASADGAGFIDAADPWLGKNLSSLDTDGGEEARSQRYRLIDGIYSAAIRNGLKSSLAGEAIMQLSRHFDLAEFATESDSITIVFSVKPREFAGNRTNIMYVGIDRQDKSLRCFVTRREQTKDFGCYNEEKSASVPLLNGEMFKPVEGVLTSNFGMRKHPILKKWTLHAGVDWAAPTGTPVRAAYDGVVDIAAPTGSAGNLVVLSHPKSRFTRYMHLSRFADGLKPGMKVRAGDLIGYVGTTGRSTGPHLHFELIVGSNPVDPLQIRAADSGSTEAVNALVSQIIKVESGGNPNAKNPLSTATGLGQFIESTWMRMMRKYKPDLVAKYSSSELLALRSDPTIAKEMVTNLARESEYYLKTRGHAITAARLYLAHFLGEAGAHQVLSAPEDALVADILGPGVVKANPFLTGMNVAAINRWTEKKMSQRSKIQRQEDKPKEMVAELPPEYKEYKRHLDKILRLASSAIQ